MWLLILMLAPPVTGADISVELLSGSKQTGRLIGLDSRHVSVEVDGKEQSIPLRELLAVTMRGAKPPSARTVSVWVELVDGSLLKAIGYSVQDRQATIRLDDQRDLEVETRNIRSVRFHPPSEALDRQWRRILDAENAGDVIVLRRSSESLDQLEGVFHDVNDLTVEFEFDDDRIRAKRTNLEGMIYFHAAGRDLPEAVCTVHEIGGSAWQAKSVVLGDQTLQVVTQAGTHVALPLEAAARLDFSSGNMTYLSDMEFELVECTPYIATRISPERIRQLYGPRRDRGFEGTRLWLGNGAKIEHFEKGLAIHSRTVLIYRLKDDYRKFTAVAGIDSRLRGQGNLELVIEGDHRELYRRTITGADPPVTIDLNIEGIRRLKFLVDFGKALDVADHLNLCNARVIK